MPAAGDARLGLEEIIVSTCLNPINAANLKIMHGSIEGGAAIGKVVLANS